MAGKRRRRGMNIFVYDVASEMPTVENNKLVSLVNTEGVG